MKGEVFKPQIYLLPRTPKTPYGTIETILVLEKQRVNPEIEWSILKKSNTPYSFDGRCNLCLEEKIQIITYKLPEKVIK